MADFFLMVVQSPGYIFGPLMMLAGLAALVLCVRATLRPVPPPSRLQPTLTTINTFTNPPTVTQV